MVQLDSLGTLAASVSRRRIGDLFKADQSRARTFSASTGDLLFDYSKTQIDLDIRAGLVDLCDQAGLAERRAAMFAGKKINETEERAVLHTALRNLDGGAITSTGGMSCRKWLATLRRMRVFAGEVRGGAIKGAGGSFTDVVNIGIGGSDLGPVMATHALSPWHDGPRLHYVSNIDGAHIADTLRALDPTRTLVIVASKTFTTIETMTNARTARAWMLDGGGDPSLQFAAVSSAVDKTGAFGIPEARVFGFADWVGGRYSVWGPVGLPVMIAAGPNAFDAFLRGGQAMTCISNRPGGSKTCR